MVRSLRESGHDVVTIEPSISRSTLYINARKAMYRVVGQHFHAERQRSIAQELARSVEQQLASLGKAPDLILSSSSLPMAYLRTDIPTAFWTDATFASMLGFYQEFNNLSSETLRSGMEVENQAIARCDHAFYSSDWAARSAIADHRGDPRKVHVVPFGPNLDAPPNKEFVLASIKTRSQHVCRLVYIGYDWERKQGDLVVQVQQRLEALGVPTELSIIGCTPKLEHTHRRIKVLGVLDKHSVADNAVLLQALSEAHFLVVPSLAECYGMVYAEASAYGIPSVACDVGGVGTVVKDGRNGLLFSKDVDADTMARRIAGIWTDKEAYEDLAHGSRKEFDDRLSWSKCIEGLLAKLAPEHNHEASTTMSEVLSGPDYLPQRAAGAHP
jgi:glycosyltransferase involved in cell wall biosynthesis